MWNLSEPGVKLALPAWAAGFLTIGPPGKSQHSLTVKKKKSPESGHRGNLPPHTKFPHGSDGSVCLQCQRPGFDPWVRKIPWRRKWQPTPVFLPENPMDRGTWKATVHRVTKNWIQLSDFFTSMTNPQLTSFSMMKSWDHFPLRSRTRQGRPLSLRQNL